MALDGLLPRVFSKLHKSFRTPYIGLLLICSTAFVASVLGTLSALINSSVFLLSFTYLSTCVSTLLLQRKDRQPSGRPNGRRIIPVLGIAFSLLLMTQVRGQEILISLVLLAVGVPLYIFFSPKKELQELKEAFLSRQAILERTYGQGQRFLAHGLHHLKSMIYRIKHIETAWSIQEERRSERSEITH
jgi:amino acid transporter